MAEIRLTQDQIDDYAELTQDRNPLHVDPVFAAASQFGGTIAHGFLLLSGPVSDLGRAEGFPKSLNCSFLAPGRPGDILTTDYESTCPGPFSVWNADGPCVEGETVNTGGSESDEGLTDSTDAAS